MYHVFEPVGPLTHIILLFAPERCPYPAGALTAPLRSPHIQNVTIISDHSLAAVLFRHLAINLLRRSALRFFHSHSGATGIFCLICRTVYFRCAANLIAASGKICVRRLKVGDLLIQILLHCALLCLAFLVLGRS